MDYALAKRLKDAGFLQEGAGKRVAPTDKIVVRRDDFAYVPTLEELIEACGKEFVQLTRRAGKRWDAESSRVETEGMSPTDAVARLWLALNEKRGRD
jgi:hypothetical protein